MAAVNIDTPVLVIGAGAMGSGIAHVAARAGHRVYLFDQNGAAVARGCAAIEQDLRVLAGKGKLTAAEAAAILARVRPIDNLQAGGDAGLAIEAVVERLDVKQALLAQLEQLLAPTAILASNTSSLSITALAAALQRPGQVAGLHFFNPAARMALVEVVSGLATDPAVAAALFDTASAWGKVPVHARSTPGFIVNRVARPYYAEALRVFGEGAATPATIDAIQRECGGFPMGPFELMDMIGHDVNFTVTRSVFDSCFGDRRYLPSLIQQELVLAGRLGRKSGQGFFSYQPGAERPAPQAEPARGAATAVVVRGDAGLLEPLLGRLAGAGLPVVRRAGPADGIDVGAARLALSDGRTASRRAADEGVANMVLADLARDYAAGGRIALAKADQCDEAAWTGVVGTLQRAGLSVSRIDDVAGMVTLRTVCMLANEAADTVLEGIASAEAVDTAMRLGTNYPEGPLAWADRLGPAFVVGVLRALREHYGEERYRISPRLQRLACSR